MPQDYIEQWKIWKFDKATEPSDAEFDTDPSPRTLGTIGTPYPTANQYLDVSNTEQPIQKLWYRNWGFTHADVGRTSPIKQNVVHLDSLAPGTLLWQIVEPNTASNDRIHALASDSQGNVFIGGTMGGFVYIAKYTPSGTQLWRHWMANQSAPDYDPAYNAAGSCLALTVDSNNNLYAGGTALGNGVVRVGGSVLNPTSIEADWLAKYDGATGAHIASVALAVGAQATSSAGVRSIAVSGTKVFVAGHTSDPRLLCACYSSADLTEIWRKDFGVGIARSVAVDSTGVPWFAGGFTSGLGVDFGSGTPMQASPGGSYDCFLVKLAAASGNYITGAAYGGSFVDGIASIAIDPFNNIYAVGSFSRQVNFGGGAMTTTDQTASGFVIKLNSSLGFVWQRKIEGEGFRDELMGSIALDGLGNVMISGGGRGNYDFGGGNRNIVSGIFCVVYTTDNVWRWDKTYNSNVASVGGFSVASDFTAVASFTPFGEVLLGWCWGGYASFDFGLGPVPHQGNRIDDHELFALKFSKP